MKNENLRYVNKPFLRVLECYVLWCIGCLTEDDEAKLVAMTPKLQKIYSVEGNWYQIVESVMSFGPRIRGAIGESWSKNSAHARGQNVVLTPQQFAEIFIEQNFPGVT